jgi:OFA family oxalate/formate antiporter-like MFS transporter
MNEDKKQISNRYCVLAAGMVIQFCAGIIYMWSVFKQPVMDHLKWDSGSATLTSSIMLSMFVLGIILGGYAQDKLGPKIITLAGSILIGCGMAATSLVTESTPWLVYITYSIVGGLGVGTVYTCTVAAVQKWFPDKRGFASGMIVCAFGFSVVVFTPLAEYMLIGLGVPNTFLIFGAGFLVICSVSSLFIQNPPAGFTAVGGKAAAKAPGSAIRQYSPKEILTTKQFYLILGAQFFTLPAYFMLNPALKSLGAARGLPEMLASLGVMLTGISSASGRLIMAWVSDRIGRKATMAVLSVIILSASLTMIFAEGVLFLICVMVMALGFGGSAGVYSAMTAESFGTKYGGMNFGLVMIGFGSSALVFQNISIWLSAGGSYGSSFAVAAATCVIALLLISQLKSPAKA